MLKKGKTPVSITHNYLIEEWDFEKNGEVRPENFSYGSHKKVWWVCSKCVYSWKSTIKNRTRRTNPSGCPICGQNKKGKTFIKNTVIKTGSLSSTHQHLMEEWDFDKNGGIRPEDLTYGSNKRVWWKCVVCGCSWSALVLSRAVKIKPSGCPVCGKEKQGRSYVRTKVIEGGSLAVTRPNLMEEWDYTKNCSLRPEGLTRGSTEKVWWLCKKCEYSWKAVINNRSRETNPSGCPVCNDSLVSKVSQKWLDDLNIPDIKGETREVRIDIGGAFYKVDGYNPKTNTVYEFLGDFWHGNPEKFDPEDINPVNKKLFGELHRKTMERIDLFKENGYNVVYIWEKDFSSITKVRGIKA